MYEVTPLMKEIANTVDTLIQILPRLKEVATNFVCRLHPIESNEDTNVDLVQMRMFSQKTRDVERVMINALNQYLKRSIFQARNWTTAQMFMMPINNHTNHGWKKEDGKLLPIWASMPLAKDTFQLDVKCTCTSALCASA